jgi:hypothetical protein|eukprot:gene9390-9470_t
MSKTNSFHGITPSIWECVKTTSFEQHGTVYAPPGAASGTATTDTIVGQVALTYAYDAASNTVNYTIIKKPFIVGESTIWEGIQDTVDGCSKS